MRHSIWLTSLCVFPLSGLLWACSSDPKEADSPEVKTALLSRAQSCEDLDAALRADARARLERQLANQGAGGGVIGVPTPGVPDGNWSGSGGTSASGGASTGGSAPPGEGTGTGTTTGAVTGTTTGTGTGALPEGPKDVGAGDYTDTNTQVRGIDEADIVKTDGKLMFLARAGELVAMQAYPAAELAVVSRVDIEGAPQDLFLEQVNDTERRILIYSSVDAAPIFEKAGLPPPAMDGKEMPAIDCFDCNYGPTLTKVTVLTATGGELEVKGELYYEGQYVSSRRTGADVRTVMQLPNRAPSIQVYWDSADEQKAELLVIEEIMSSGKKVDDFSSQEIQAKVQAKLAEIIADKNVNAIEAMTHADWVPHVFKKQNGQLVATTLPCDRFYIPPVGSGEPGATFIAELSLDELSGDAQGSAFIGVAETLYQNAEHLILAANEWVAPSKADGSSLRSVIHNFDITEEGELQYVASGEVPGSVYKQFAIDEKDGVIRVVTTEQKATSENRITTLRVDGTELKQVGALAGLAPGETVRAVRYIGDIAYVVTAVEFKDPLFVVDVKDAANPRLLGELHIPGFSTYVHPLGANHLLTIGQDQAGWEGSSNIALQIFDVTDPKTPKSAHKFVLEPGNSSAEFDHRAFTFHDAKGLLALPFQSYAAGPTIELFDVSVETGFREHGRVTSEGLETEQCGYATPFTRSVLIDDTVYGVSMAGLVAESLDGEDRAVLPLNQPGDTANCGGWTGGPTGGTGGWIGTGGSTTGGSGAIGGSAGAPAEGGAGGTAG
jgi:hypothetical protein